MNKLLAALIAGIVSLAAVAHAATPLAQGSAGGHPAHVAKPAAAHKKMKKHKAKKAHKAKKSSHKTKKRKTAKK